MILLMGENASNQPHTLLTFIPKTTKIKY